MTDDDSRPSAAAPQDDKPQAKPSQAPTRSFFSIPPPIKRIFDKFPLIIYEENSLPVRAPKDSRKHVLYVFGRAEDLKRGGLSYNPACLKWQVSHDLWTRTYARGGLTVIGCNRHISSSVTSLSRLWDRIITPRRLERCHFSSRPHQSVMQQHRGILCLATGL